MSNTNGSQTITEVPDRNVIVSACVGKTNIYELKWLSETILSIAKKWEHTGWAYIADCSQMSLVSPAESKELVAMTKAFVNAGCEAFGFAEGKSVFLKIQAHNNTERSNTGILEGHFETVDEALNWIKKTVKY